MLHNFKCLWSLKVYLYIIGKCGSSIKPQKLWACFPLRDKIYKPSLRFQCSLLHKSSFQTCWLIFFFQKGLVHGLKHCKCSIIYLILFDTTATLTHTYICIYYFNNVFNNVYIHMCIYWYLLSHQNWALWQVSPLVCISLISQARLYPF